MSTTILDLDALLDQSLEAVEAAPEFVTPDTGNYRLGLAGIKAEQREARDKDKAIAEGKPTVWGQLRFTYSIVEVHSIEEGGMPVKPGSLYSETFNLTEQGLPYLKARVVDLITALGGSEEDANIGIREMVASLPQMGIVFDCHINTREIILDNGNPWTQSDIKQISAVAE